MEISDNVNHRISFDIDVSVTRGVLLNMSDVACPFEGYRSTGS